MKIVDKAGWAAITKFNDDTLRHINIIDRVVGRCAHGVLGWSHYASSTGRHRAHRDDAAVQHCSRALRRSSHHTHLRRALLQYEDKQDIMLPGACHNGMVVGLQDVTASKSNSTNLSCCPVLVFVTTA